MQSHYFSFIIVTLQNRVSFVHSIGALSLPFNQLRFIGVVTNEHSVDPFKSGTLFKSSFKS